MLTFEDLAKNSFVISIDKNRLTRFYSIFKAIGWPEDLLPKRVNGVIFADNHLKNSSIPGCTKAHIKVIEIAKERDLPFCLIFEDDAYPRSDFKDRITKVLRALPAYSDGVLLGYTNPLMLSKTPNQIIRLVNKFSYIGSHAYVIFKSGYDKALKLLKEHIHADHTFRHMNNTHMAIDPIFIQYIQEPGIHFFKTGYIFNYKQGLEDPPEGFPRYEDLINTDDINNTENTDNKEKKDEIL